MWAIWGKSAKEGFQSFNLTCRAGLSSLGIPGDIGERLLTLSNSSSANLPDPGSPSVGLLEPPRRKYIRAKKENEDGGQIELFRKVVQFATFAGQNNKS